MQSQDIKTSKSHILIAEDEEQLLSSMEIALRRTGFTVSKAKNGSEALSIIKKCYANDIPIDLLVTDIQMPEMNGEELVNTIRCLDTSLPILVITGFGDKDLVVRLLRTGCTDYLDKPFSSETFVQTIEKIFKQRLVAQVHKSMASANEENQNVLLERELDLMRVKFGNLQAQVEQAAGEFHNLIAIDSTGYKVHHAFKYLPLQMMGGDFAAIKNTDNGCIVLVADIAGHDMAASFYTMVIKTFFDEHCQNTMSGRFMFELLNRALMESTNGERAVSATLLRLDFKEMWAEVTCAASPPVIVMAAMDNLPRPIYAPGSVLGMQSDIEFDVHRLQIKTGDRFFIYTDGLVSPVTVDGRTGVKKHLFPAGIGGLLLNHCSGTLENIVENIWHDVSSACRNKFTDDALLIGIEIPEV